mmetsp:Transcript_255/g.620  ORF Transcript_255/g.620 Transcript_255/m.620 type:complete len:915 (+) Transcript_255:51-2795(+)
MNEQDDKVCEIKENQRRVFTKAREYVQPGAFFKFIAGLYAERQLIVLYSLHFIATMVIWVHYTLLRFEEKKHAAVEGEARYWWKRTAPPLVFGAKHAILFQTALLPLTMSRFSISQLSTSWPGITKFVPLNRMFEIHIHLGYLMVGLAVFCTMGLILLNGLICSDGDSSGCDNLTAEIMLTGYAIVLALVAVAVTSYLRYRLPYEVFYIVHHLVFIMYILAAAHTLDNLHRAGVKNRYQDFPWFTASIAYYLGDRACMYINNRYNAPVQMSAVIRGSGGASTIILKLKRPALFEFQPGQYAYLKMDSIEPHWHPFTLASDTRSETLDFYIEVVGKEDSWTHRMFRLLEDHLQGDSGTMWVQVMGPYGTPFANMEEFSHCLSIGSGTGIVPTLSLLQHHVRHMARLHPQHYFRDLKLHERHVRDLELSRQPRLGSVAAKVMRQLHGNAPPPEAYFPGFRTGDDNEEHAGGYESSNRFYFHPSKAGFDEGMTSLNLEGLDGSKGASGADFHNPSSDQVTTADDSNVDDTTRQRKMLQKNIFQHSKLGGLDDRQRHLEMIKKAAAKQIQHIKLVVFLIIMPIFGVALIAFTISWNRIPLKIHKGMDEFLAAATILFQLLFAIISIFFWNTTPWTYLDVAVSILAPVIDWFFFEYKTITNVTFHALFAYLVPMSYITGRVWYAVVKSHHHAFRRDAVRDGITSLNRLEFVWVTRSAMMVSELMPEIQGIWDSLVEEWGCVEEVEKVLSITVFVTDKDQSANELLKEELAGTSLFEGGSFRFERPDFAQIVEDHTVELAATCEHSYSLMAFCGSPGLAAKLHEIKIANDMTAAITGNQYHQMEFVAESYGGYKRDSKPKKKKATATDKKPTEEKPKEKGENPNDEKADQPPDAEVPRRGRRLSTRISSPLSTRQLYTQS